MSDLHQKEWHLKRIKEEIDAGRTQNALSYVSFAISEADTKTSNGEESVREALQAVYDWQAGSEVLPLDLRQCVKDALRIPQRASYQDRVSDAHHALFHDDPTDVAERVARFFEEAVETCQALGLTHYDADKLLNYTYDRPVGDPKKEIGAALLTLASLCVVAGYDLMECGEADLEKLQRPETIARIRAKRSTRHGRGALPGFDPAAIPETKP